uniref:Uncharacterized protein n=1 Tax=Lactuca sativa TaxID=4236 RepID=A0A9R1WF93_LACSA|nr:hypothetical protein LSAT_V11C100039960 [Lactuca sativa]
MRRIGGFDHLPRLESLVLRGCTILLDVSKSIEQCDELVHVNLSYCNKLGKLPRTIGILKKLSLANNNLSTESFPMDFSWLSMLKRLYLDGNPIVSLPRCVRSLPRINWLSMVNCNMLTSLEHPPHTNMYYEFGIFSTIYGGEEMPNWIVERRIGSSMSLTIPSSPKKLKGLNLCCNHTWIYQHYIRRVDVIGKSLTLLSHWMFGMNEMECGDHITICMRLKPFHIECGVSFVYDDGDADEKEDALGYYKSWIHIIGGDLALFQLTTGEYILTIWRFLRSEIDMRIQSDESLFGDGAHFKDEQRYFRALSQRKSNVLEDG